MQKEENMSRLFLHVKDTWFKLCAIGIGAALAGLGTALIALNTPFSFTSLSDKPLFYLGATLASLLIGPLFWWFFILKPDRTTLCRGIVIGMLGSFAAHPLAWFIGDLMAYLMGRQLWMGSTFVDSPLAALLGSPFYAVFSLIYVGWITTLAGGVVGGMFVSAQRICLRCQRVSRSM
jgi:hypothetical protein